MDSPAELCPDAYKRLFESSGLKVIAREELDKKQCAYILRQYQSYVEVFPRLLAIGISKLYDDESRLPLVANLWEEHGDGNLSKAHRKLYTGILTNVAEMFPFLLVTLSEGYRAAAINFAVSAEAYLQKASAAAALGFLGPGTEGTTADLYRIIAKLLGPFSPYNIDTFFSLHCDLDVQHAALFASAIRAVLKEDAKHTQSEYVNGIATALTLECTFWDAVVAESQSRKT
jgi:hypothetical protein